MDERGAGVSPSTGEDRLPTIEEIANALYETDPPESWMRTGTDEYRKRAAAMLDFIRADRALYAATPEADPPSTGEDRLREAALQLVALCVPGSSRYIVPPEYIDALRAALTPTGDTPKEPT